MLRPTLERNLLHFIEATTNGFEINHSPSTAIDLEEASGLPRNYDSGHAFAKQYRLEDHPIEVGLRANLQLIAYANGPLTHRGKHSKERPVEGTSTTLTIFKKRQYKHHKRIEGQRFDRFQTVLNPSFC